MIEKRMGRLCKHAGQCHVYKGKVKLKQPLFLVKNIYCNNGFRWWQKCAVFEMFNNGSTVDESMLPSEDLRPE